MKKAGKQENLIRFGIKLLSYYDPFAQKLEHLQQLYLKPQWDAGLTRVLALRADGLQALGLSNRMSRGRAMR
jgi:hypothetical protein